MKILNNRRGEGYIDVAITVMIIAFLLIFLLSIVSLVATSQRMKSVADQIAEYAAVNGRTDIDSFVEEQRDKLGMDFTCSFSGTETWNGTKKVQLGDKIVCTISYEVHFVGFGTSFHVMTITADAMTLSRVYWK